jgi:hypothetical protein
MKTKMKREGWADLNMKFRPWNHNEKQWLHQYLKGFFPSLNIFKRQSAEKMH